MGDIAFINPVFGDHAVITFKVRSNVVVKEKTMRRDWRHYSKEALNTELLSVKWSLDFDSVQSYWNVLRMTLFR